MDELDDKPVPVETPPAKPPVVYEETQGDADEDELNKRSEMPFLDHLEELRRRLLWCLGYLFVGIVIAFYVNSRYDLLSFIIAPVKPYLANGKLLIIKPTEGFMIAMKLSLAFGLILASPIILYHIWAFIAPALLKRERSVVLPMLVVSIFMFVLGAVMAFYITLPLGMQFFSKFQFASTEFMLTAGSYLDMVLMMVLATGLVFELPIAILLLARLGLISPKFLREKRRHAIIAIFIIAMIVTPPDPGSMILVAVPMVFLYELSVWIAYAVARKRNSS
ncbi:MAG: twin-arginine translocase subunit TatC [Candidatus Glassbacteria bacterium]